MDIIRLHLPTEDADFTKTRTMLVAAWQKLVGPTRQFDDEATVKFVKKS